MLLSQLLPLRVSGMCTDARREVHPAASLRGQNRYAKTAIERALDLAVLQRELVDGTRGMLGVDLTSPDASAKTELKSPQNR